MSRNHSLSSRPLLGCHEQAAASADRRWKEARLGGPRWGHPAAIRWSAARAESVHHRLSVRMSMGRPPPAILTSKNVGAPILHGFRRTTVNRGRVALNANGVSEVVGNNRLHRFPFVVAKVGKPRRNLAEGSGDVGGPALALAAYGEQSHRVGGHPKRDVGLRIAGVEGALGVDEHRQEVTVKILGRRHAAILSPRGQAGNEPAPCRRARRQSTGVARVSCVSRKTRAMHPRMCFGQSPRSVRPPNARRMTMPVRGGTTSLPSEPKGIHNSLI
jgi:hypothetical protein